MVETLGKLEIEGNFCKLTKGNLTVIIFQYGKMLFL